MDCFCAESCGFVYIGVSDVPSPPGGSETVTCLHSTYLFGLRMIGWIPELGYTGIVPVCPMVV